MSRTVNDLQEQLLEATRARDLARRLQILSELIAQTEGAARAEWLQSRAALRSLYSDSTSEAMVRADREEALRVGADDPATVVLGILSAVAASYQTEPLRGIPPAIRRRIVPELYHDFRYWHSVANLHYQRCRWYQSYRSRSRQLKIYFELPPEKLKVWGGWYLHLHAYRALAAMRCGRMAVAEADIAKATAFDAEQERKHINPLPLALARADLAYLKGDYHAARFELQRGVIRLENTNLPKLDGFLLCQVNLLSAHIALAEGNPLGFDHFCGEALAVALRTGSPWMEARVRAVMTGKLELQK